MVEDEQASREPQHRTLSALDVPNIFLRWNPVAMDFEFNEHKSRSNKFKHGVDFAEAQALWQDDDRIEVSARTSDEPRFVILGRIEAKLWAAVITYREGRVRIISVRRARQREVELYESRRL
jgi:uncharacterized DUF497 family protein